MTTLYNSKDTIAALATAVGIGGISVIRVSGEQSLDLVDVLFRGGGSLKSVPSHTIHYGSMNNNSGELIDTVLVSVFRNPHSYTGDDVVEISCHGGYYISQKVLTELYRLGIRPAEPGEFTMRAFLNGKMDLAQAEAVADLIYSKSERSHKTSIDQLNGRLSKYTNSLRGEILEICSLLELELDFSQEGIEITDKGAIIKKLFEIKVKIQNLLDSYNSGKHMREGVRVALVGKPNTGKSSLMNILLNEERAIVSHIPGTTRDTIEESIVIDGLEFIFTDTAGLRESGDVIEQEGIKRTTSTVQSSDIVCIVVDSSIELSSEDATLYKRVQELIPKNTKRIYVFNKNDIKSDNFELSTSWISDKKAYISCKKESGIDELKMLLKETALPNFDSLEASIMICNVRHKTAFEMSIKELDISINSLKNGMSDDFVAADLRIAIDFLGEIIGITTSEDILNNIFSKFCIGK